MFPNLFSWAQRANVEPASFHFKCQLDFSLKQQTLDQPLPNDPPKDNLIPCPAQSRATVLLVFKQEKNVTGHVASQGINPKLHSGS